MRYLGKDAGHLNIKAISGLLEDTVEIDDLFYYNSTNYTSTQTNSIQLPTGDFEISFEIKPTTRSTSYANVNIGTNDNNRIMIGQAGSDGSLFLQIKKNSNILISQATSTKAPTTNYSLVKYSYVNGLHTFIGLNNETITYTDSTADRSIIFKIDIAGNNLKNLKIHKL